MIATVYKIQSKSGEKKAYVGGTINRMQRFGSHRFHLRHNKHQNKPLQEHFNKYGLWDLEFMILEEFEYQGRDHLHEREQIHMDQSGALFNVCPSAGTNKGANYDLRPERKKRRQRYLSKKRNREIGINNALREQRNEIQIDNFQKRINKQARIIGVHKDDIRRIAINWGLEMLEKLDKSNIYRARNL